MINEDAGGDRGIQGILHAAHGNIDSGVAQFDQIIGNAFDFITDNQTGRALRIKFEIRHAPVGLFKGEDMIAFRFKSANRLGGVFSAIPLDTFFGADRGLGNFRARRITGDPAKPEFFDTGPVAAAEDRTDIMKTSYVIEDHNQRDRDPRLRRLSFEDFLMGKFSYRHILRTEKSPSSGRAFSSPSVSFHRAFPLE